MKKLVLALPLLVVATLFAASAHADTRTLDPVTDPLGDCYSADSPDQCLASGTTTTICTDSWGCPQCGLSQDGRNAVCFRLFGNYGWCSCSPYGIGYDKYGNVVPKCILKGTCNTR